MSIVGALELVKRLRSGTLSRNRDFDTFARDAEGARALRVSRYLRSLEKDLAALAPGGVGVDVQLRVERREEGGRRITIEVPAVRSRRVAMLSAEEYELLREHPGARAVLDRAES
jgi:hypothetical protein